MLYSSVALFAVFAAFGLTILIKWLTKKDVSGFVVYSHGIAAVLALIILIGYAIQYPDNFPKVSLIMFAVAAVVGLYMFVLDLQKKFSPLALAFTHALVAISAFVLLLLFVFA